jgi:hypothetical protein
MSGDTLHHIIRWNAGYLEAQRHCHREQSDTPPASVNTWRPNDNAVALAEFDHAVAQTLMRALQDAEPLL